MGIHRATLPCTDRRLTDGHADDRMAHVPAGALTY
jgi:hypothetical protein